jgi:homoserine kinase
VTVKQVLVYSPGSIANLGPGFDVFGIALDNLGDKLLLKEIQEPEVKLSITGIGAEKIPLQPEKNSSGAILSKVRNDYRLEHGFRAEINKGLPSGTGMGSSGASAAATAIAVDNLLRLRLCKQELIQLAAYGEEAVTGQPHADNVAASIMGGFTMVGEDYDVVRLDAPQIGIVVTVPEIDIPNKTKRAREILPKKVNLTDAVKNISYATRMTAATALKDPVLFGKNICDFLIEPYRASMIPNFWKVKQAALNAGAYGCSISGGGPSVFAVGEPVIEIAQAMVEAFNIPSKVYHTQPTNIGGRVI